MFYPADFYRTRCIIESKNPINVRIIGRSFTPLLLNELVTFAITVGGTDYVLNKFPEHRAPFFPFIIAGGISIGTQLLGTPLDVIKTRAMENPNATLLQHLRELSQNKEVITKTFWPRIIRGALGTSFALGLLHTLPIFTKAQP